MPHTVIDMGKRNEWERRHGAARRAIDRKLLAEVEAQIAREEAATDREAQRTAIARAFGRPSD